MTREEKEDRKLELFDNILFGEKMIARGEATREKLQSQFDEIEKVLKEKYHLNIEMNYDIIDEDFIASGWNLVENYNEKEIK